VKLENQILIVSGKSYVQTFEGIQI